MCIFAVVFGLGYVKLPAVHTFSPGIDFYVCTSVTLESSVVPGSHRWKDIPVPVPMSHVFHYCCNSYFQYWRSCILTIVFPTASDYFNCKLFLFWSCEIIWLHLYVCSPDGFVLYAWTVAFLLIFSNTMYSIYLHVCKGKSSSESLWTWTHYMCHC